MKRRPKWLPVGRQDGEEWVERELVRAHLLHGLPQAESAPILTAWPIEAPRCRYCGRLSIAGWAGLICDRCKKLRASIECRGIDIVNRRGWRGPPTIRDDELLLEIQRRLCRQDYQALKEQDKASGTWAKRVAEVRERATEPAAEECTEPEFAEAAE
jgi:hypothetical protein